MITRREAVAAAISAGGLGLSRAAMAAPDATLVPASVWAAGLGARMRLVRGAPLGAGRGWQAAIEIALDAGYRTYWRMPGDAGVPPAFDWSGSVNMAAVAADWPAPKRFEEAGASVIGYAGGGVVLPLRVSAKDDASPVELRLTLTYAACNAICVPEKAAASLVLHRDAPEGTYVALIEAAGREVPRRVDPATLGLDRQDALDLSLTKGGLGLTLRPRLEDGESLLDVFVEGSDNWLFGAPHIGGKGPDSHASLTLVDHPKAVDRSGRIPFTLTLVTDMRAVETSAAATPSD